MGRQFGHNFPIKFVHTYRIYFSGQFGHIFPIKFVHNPMIEALFSDNLVVHAYLSNQIHPY